MTQTKNPPINPGGFIIILLVTYGCSQKSTNDPEFFGANLSLSTCLRHAGDAQALDNFITNKMKIKEPLPPHLSRHFLNGSRGKAWSFSSPDGSYAISYTDDGLCTVFIKKADVPKYISHLNDGLKRISEQFNFKVSTNNIPMFAGEDELKTYQFFVELPDKKIEVAVSAIKQVKGNFQIAFSSSLF